MIEKLIVRNFQSHSDTELDFASGVNVIVGPTDSGKTALLRALNWVVGNRPLGTSFRSRWGGDTEVSLVTSEGETICRRRTDKENSYEIGSTKLKAIKSDVPDEVSSVLRMNEINLQSQHDQPFLLSSGSAEVARVLNRVANLDDIEVGQREANRRVRELTGQISRSQEEVTELSKRLNEFKDLDSWEETMRGIEGIVADVDSGRSRLAGLLLLKNEVGVFGAEEEKVRGWLQKVEPVAKEAMDLFIHTREVDSRRETIRGLLHGYQQCLEEWEGRAWVDESLGSIDVGVVLSTKITNDESELDYLVRMVGEIRKLRQEEERLEVIEDELIKEFTDRMPEVCPLCGRSG